MTIANRTFGVEIECKGISRSQACSAIQAAGIQARIEAYGHSRPRMWKLVTDASVVQGFEVVSPVLRGENGIEEVRKVAKALTSAGASVDRSCGLHVHVSAQGMSRDDLLNIVCRYARFEDEIDGFMPRSRRGSSNTYCQSHRRWISNPSSLIRSVNSGGNRPEAVANVFYDRYFKVNLQSYIRQGTIEFRQHSGTTNADKIENWIRFCVNFVEQSQVANFPDLRAVTQSVSQASSSVRTNITPRARLGRLLGALIDETENVRLTLTIRQLQLRSGYAEGTIRAMMSRLRTEFGLQIRCLRGRYYLVRNERNIERARQTLARLDLGVVRARRAPSAVLSESAASTSDRPHWRIRQSNETHQAWRERLILEKIADRRLNGVSGDTGCTVAELARVSGYNENSIPAVISRIRSNLPSIQASFRRTGVWATEAPVAFRIRGRVGRYFILGPEDDVRKLLRTCRLENSSVSTQASSGQNTTATGNILERICAGASNDAWHRGLETEVRSFYQERAQELAA